MEKDKGIRENLFPNQIVVFSGIKTEAKSRKYGCSPYVLIGELLAMLPVSSVFWAIGPL
jgi:hypothetical protein